MDITIWLEILLFVGLLGLSAFFSSSETSLFSLSDKLGERHDMLSGRVEVDTLRQELGLEIPRGKYAAIAGFLLERAKDVPEPGEVIVWQGIDFTIHRALPHVIQEVRIQW